MNNMDIKYPNITVELSGQDGNAFSIMGRVMRAMKAAKVPANDIDAYLTEAKSGDYDHVLRTTMAWVDVT